MSLPNDLLALIADANITTSFVVDRDGQVARESGSSQGIGNATDKRLLGALRSSSEVVLTSGLTARVDRYRMPKTADLAIYTRQGVSELNLEPVPPQRLWIFGESEAGDYLEALNHLLSIGYQRIHVEFGPTGFAQLKPHLDLKVISSIGNEGLERFTEQHNLSAKATFELEDLIVWAC